MSIHNPTRIDSSELFTGRKLFVDQRMDHGLCLLWQQSEKGITSPEKIKDIMRKEVDGNLFDDMVKMRYVKIENNQAHLTEESSHIARDIIRRRRLAERLLEDVLDVSRNEVETQACELEHIIDKNIEESICTLLGHPKECPHGLPIPEGNCCTRAKSTVESIVLSMDHFSSGDKGKVAYILTRDHPQLHKLMSLGIVPGTLVHIHQIFPSFIIKVDETQIALEREVAKNIYLRKFPE